MILMRYSRRFATREDGAVTVDWVVLTAAIAGLGIAVLTSVTSGTKSVTEAVTGELEGTTVPTDFP